MRVGRALDWTVDSAMPVVLLGGLVVAWLATVVVLFAVAPWWAGVVAFAVGLPFLAAVANS